MTHHLWFEEKLPAWYAPDGGSHESEAPELQAVTRFAKSVPGWLGDSQGLALYQMARLTVAGGVLEIGSFCGKSTLFIALGCKHSDAAFYAVDPHKPMSKGGKWQFGADFQPFRGNSLWELRKTLHSCDLAAYVTLLIATSEEARREFTDQPLKLLFIDGSHDYADVRLDYELWQEMIIKGGRLVFHDSNFEGVNQTIQANLDRNRYVHEGTVGSGRWAMTVWQRVR
jgi:predicted O-methyltransferase YrrM